MLFNDARELLMFKNHPLIVLILLGLLSLGSFGEESNKVAKVIILKGKVFEIRPGQKPVELKRGMWVHEGSQLQSQKSSFAKLLFIDKSQMNLGADSAMKIQAFPKNKAGIIDLLKGKVRSKVTKNYMDIDKNGSKLFIKTKTAAMGVRGTDFQVIFNPRNAVTSLVTFEGAVAMAKLEGVQNIDQRALDAQLNRREAVVVRQGQYSGVMPNQNRASIPVKISPTQLETLKNTDPSVSQKENRKPASTDTEKKKVVRSIVPKGLDPKKVADVNNGSVDKAISDGVGKQVAQTVVQQTQEQIQAVRNDGPPPEGFVDSATGAYAPPAGGFIDEKTGLYVPPAEGSTFDPNAGVYIPPPEVGTVDTDTGSYVPPEGYQLVDSGELVPVGDGGREPASLDGSTTTINPDGTTTVNVLQPTTLDGGEKDLVSGAEIGTMTEAENLAKDFQLESTMDFNNPDLSTTLKERSRVEFRIRR